MQCRFQNESLLEHTLLLSINIWIVLITLPVDALRFQYCQLRAANFHLGITFLLPQESETGGR